MLAHTEDGKELKFLSALKDINRDSTHQLETHILAIGGGSEDAQILCWGSMCKLLSLLTLAVSRATINQHKTNSARGPRLDRIVGLEQERI